MSDSPTNENYNPASQNDKELENDKFKDLQKMIDSLTALNQSFQSSVNSTLKVDSIGDYASKGLSMMKGDTQSSALQEVFDKPEGQQALDTQDKSASQQNQASSGLNQAMNVVEENPEMVLAAL